VHFPVNLKFLEVQQADNEFGGAYLFEESYMKYVFFYKELIRRRTYKVSKRVLLSSLSCSVGVLESKDIFR
jgi:hypothetical protein